MSESQIQQDVTAAANAITGLVNEVTTDVASISSALVTIQQQIANGQPVDDSALNAAVQTIASVQASLDAVAANAAAIANPAPSAPTS